MIHPGVWYSVGSADITTLSISTRPTAPYLIVVGVSHYQNRNIRFVCRRKRKKTEEQEALVAEEREQREQQQQKKKKKKKNFIENDACNKARCFISLCNLAINNSFHFRGP